jgi:5-hydroxyisourate hydrolase-like protein (transthyretin family)
MITTRVFDVSRGVPTARVQVELDLFITGQGWHEVGHGVTNGEGEVEDFGEVAAPGVYRLMFDIAAYIPDACFPSISVTLDVRDPTRRYHLPLELSRYGYTVHREVGSGEA